MFGFRQKIERFCYRHPGFGIPELMKYLTIANVAFWIFGAVNKTFLSYMVFAPQLILQGQIWRIFSFIFYPPNTGLLAFVAFYFYYWLGSTLERNWGAGQFTIYFFSGVLLTVIYGFAVYFITGKSVMLDSTYIYLSMFFSFAALYPDMQVLFMFILPIKMKYLALVDAAFFIFSVATTSFPLCLLPIVAVLNFLLFCWDDLKAMLPGKRSPKTVSFKREAAKIRREQQTRLYTHKCSVCGRTDTDYPGLEFRYCSRCQGYHCFCSEHINNHIHFTE